MREKFQNAIKYRKDILNIAQTDYDMLVKKPFNEVNPDEVQNAREEIIRAKAKLEMLETVYESINL